MQYKVCKTWLELEEFSHIFLLKALESHLWPKIAVGDSFDRSKGQYCLQISVTKIHKTQEEISL